jgi:hypothetical protein
MRDGSTADGAALGISRQGAIFLYKKALRKLRKKSAIRELHELAQRKARGEASQC